MTKQTPAYYLKDIRHFYGDKKILDIPNLKIEPGSITGIIGPNGSGKSTLLKLMAFIQKPTFGQVFYNGKPEWPFSPTIRSKVTVLTQKPYLLKRSVYENIIYGLKIRKDTKNIIERVKQTLGAVGLDYDNFAHRKWHELSGGEAQRVALAARLILKPDVLLLDEPIASVDMESAKLIREASLNARRQWGTTLVVVSHDLHWLYSISDHQFSIYKGKMFATGIENVISGPFEQAGDQMLFKPLPNGRRILLKDTSTRSSTAIIRKKDITLDLEKQAGHPQLNQLDGSIAAMMLEKKSGFILATISCHDLSFVLRITSDQITDLSLYPGKQVVLKFLSTDVEWI
ncbi:MAG: energy-coupling factor ABC transporter ATP-binding protein [Desulfobacula sp.]|nr:energy-coupling factor ABC transporter ATP-binding protein [Desulfobacula sp.]